MIDVLGPEKRRRRTTQENVSYTHSEPTRRYAISYAVFCLKKKKKKQEKKYFTKSNRTQYKQTK